MTPERVRLPTGRPKPGGTFDRYVVRVFAGPFLYTLAALASLALVVDVFEKLDWLIPHARELDIPLGRVLLKVSAFYGARLGLLLFDVGPAVPLVAGVVAAAGMVRRRELVAAKAAGVSAQRALLPICVLSAAMGLFAFVARETAGPAMVRCAMEGRSTLLGANRKPVALVSIQGAAPRAAGLVLNVEEFDLKHRAARCVLATFWEEGRDEPTYLWAPGAKWAHGSWRFDGRGLAFRYTDEPDSSAISPAGDLETTLSPRIIEMERLGVEGIPLGELAAGRARTEMATELHRRLAAPLGWVALLLLGLPLVARGALRGPLVGFALSLGLVAVYAAVTMSGWSLARSGQVPPTVGVWVPQLAATLLGILAYRRMET